MISATVAGTTQRRKPSVIVPDSKPLVSDAPGFILRASDAPLEVVHVSKDNPELLKEYFGMRFQTYCVRKGHESPNKYPDGRMRDEYDDHALWSLVRHTKTGVYLGAVRFVLRPEGKQLPFEMFRSLPYTDGPIAEISSFLYCPERIKEAKLPEWHGCKFGLGLVSFRLMQACFAMGSMHKIEAVCGLMCPVLLRMFKKEKVNFELVPDENGKEEVVYHGVRMPCWRKASDLLKGIKGHSEDLFNLVKPRNEEYLSFLMGDYSD